MWANFECNMGTNMKAIVNEAFWWDGHVILSPVQISPSLGLRRERILFPSDHEWKVAFSITSEF